MGFRQQGLDQLVHVVGGLLEGVGRVDPVEDHVARALMSQLQRHFVLTGRLVHFRKRPPQEQQGLVAFSNEAVVLSRDRRCSVCVVVLLHR